MNWRDLKAFVNDLPESELDKQVILWREDEAITKIEAEQLEEDHYIDLDDPENGCFPVSECKNLEPDTRIKKVYDKGHPILLEEFYKISPTTVRVLPKAWIISTKLKLKYK